MHRSALPSAALFAAALLAALPAQAQRPAPAMDAEAATDARAADTLVVTARRGLSSATLATATVTPISLAERTSVADAIERGTTAFVRAHGLTGLASLSVRGTGASQTAVLLDGLRLTDPQLGQLDLHLLPAALLGEATLVAGSGSAYDGSDAVGGTLHLAPRTGGGGAALEVGSFGTLRAEAHGGASAGRVALSAAATAESVQGDFPYRDPVFLTTVRRNGAESRLAALVVRAASARTRAGLWLAAADRGLAPSIGTPPTNERQADGLARVWTSHVRTVGAATLRLAGYAHAGRLRYVHPGLDVDDTGRTQVVGIEAEATRPLGARTHAGAGASATTARATHPSLSGDAREHALAAFVHGTHTRARLTVAPALRVDAYLRAPSNLVAASPRLGLRYALGGFAARASAATAFRAPTLNDRFWAGAGRPDLRPERARLAEVGLAFDRRTGQALWHADVAAFAHAVRDQIVWTPGADGRWRPENVQQTATHGLEAAARWARADGWGRPTLDVSAAYTHAVDRSDPAAPTYGRQLRYVPRVVARASASATPGRFAFDLAARLVGTRYATADASQALAPVVTLDAGAAVRAGPLRLGLRLDNALGTSYQLLDGYPLPGRALYVRLAYDAP